MVVSLTLVGHPGTAAPQTASPLSLISAQRSKSYQTASGEIMPRDQAADVVIVVRVGGLTRDEFRQIRQDSISVMSGDEQLPPSVLLTGVVDGKAELKAVFVGPKATLDMRLVLGSYPPLAFTAEQAIVDQLR
jgi:hypothetical protein